MSTSPVYRNWREAWEGEIRRMAHRDPETGCLLMPSSARITIPDWLPTPTTPARILWTAIHGAPPGGLMRRLCPHRRCVEPSHRVCDNP